MHLRPLLFLALAALLSVATPSAARSVDRNAKEFAKDQKDDLKKEMQRYMDLKKKHDAEKGAASAAQFTPEENKKRAVPQVLQQIPYRGTLHPDCTKPYYIYILMGKADDQQHSAAEYSYARNMQILPAFYKQIKKEGRADVVLLWMGDAASLHDFRSKFGNKFPTVILTPALRQQLPGLEMNTLDQYSNDFELQLVDADGNHLSHVSNALLITTLMKKTW